MKSKYLQVENWIMILVTFFEGEMDSYIDIAGIS